MIAMKTKLTIGLLCVIALAGLLTITKSPAQGNPHQVPEQQYDVVLMLTTFTDRQFRLYVYNGSSGAPQFYDYYTANGRQLIPVVDVLAALKKAGFRIVVADINAYGYTLERP